MFCSGLYKASDQPIKAFPSRSSSKMENESSPLASLFSSLHLCPCSFIPCRPPARSKILILSKKPERLGSWSWPGFIRSIFLAHPISTGYTIREWWYLDHCLVGISQWTCKGVTAAECGSIFYVNCRKGSPLRGREGAVDSERWQD